MRRLTQPVSVEGRRHRHLESPIDPVSGSTQMISFIFFFRYLSPGRLLWRHLSEAYDMVNERGERRTLDIEDTTRGSDRRKKERPPTSGQNEKRSTQSAEAEAEGPDNDPRDRPPEMEVRGLCRCPCQIQSTRQDREALFASVTIEELGPIWKRFGPEGQWLPRVSCGKFGDHLCCDVRGPATRES